MHTHTYTLDECNAAAAQFVRQLAPGRTATVVALHGDLGAGKTTFVQAVARAFGVTADVVSPTFVIQKRYELHNQPFRHLVHIDAYRLTEARELAVLGWDELLHDPGNLIFIEWPERVDELLPADTRHIHLTYIDASTRRISFEQPS